MNFFNLTKKKKRKVVEQATDEVIKEQQLTYTFEQGIEEGYAIAKRLYYKEKEIIKAIEDLKDETRARTGAFKYDLFYDECINIVKKIYEN